MLDRLEGLVEGQLVAKLIVPLASSDGLSLVLPSVDEVESDIDEDRVPPSLVVHPPLPRSDGEYEEYRRPLDEVFITDAHGEVVDGWYVAWRDKWDTAEDAPYQRQLVFVRVVSNGAAR